MDGKGFFLGILAAFLLFLLWKKEGNQIVMALSPQGPSPQPGAGAGGCVGCGGPTASASPQLQNLLTGWNDGQISPGAPPLNSPLAVGSFYADSGPTPWSGYAPSSRGTAIFGGTAKVILPNPVPNTPGSATTPATDVPIRALATVPSYQNQGFQQRYNIVGIYTQNLRHMGVI